MANATPILESLITRGVKRKILKWTRHFLSDRTTTVLFQGRLSDSRTFENGIPQGNILSPFLFDVLMENVVTLPIGATTKVLCYADDITIITTGPNYTAKEQNAIVQVAKTCQRLGLKLNPCKTKTVLFGT